MIPTSVIMGLIFNIAVCFLIPIITLIYLVKKDRKRVKSFLIGMLIFFITQILIRIPILTYILPNMMWFLKLMTNPYLYGIFLGLTAGIFEEVGRYIAFKFMLKKNHQWEDGISYGIGHGGIEAMLITGMTNINLLIGCIMINSGKLEALLNQTNNANLESLYNICMSLTSGTTLLAGVERIFAISIQIGLSMIVLYGVRNRKIIYLFIAILIHTLINAPIVILPAVFNIGVIGVEIYFFIWAIVLGAFTIYSKKLYKKQEDININS